MYDPANAKQGGPHFYTLRIECYRLRHDTPDLPDCSSQGWNVYVGDLSRAPASGPKRRSLAWLDVGRHGLCGLRNNRIGVGLVNHNQCARRGKRNGSAFRFQRSQCGVQLTGHYFWRAGFLVLPAGFTPSRIPPSQSSVPFFTLRNVIVPNPDRFSQAVVSAME